MARILLYTSPASGHMFPPVPTALELSARGHEIIVRTGAARSRGTPKRGDRGGSRRPANRGDRGRRLAGVEPAERDPSPVRRLRPPGRVRAARHAGDDRRRAPRSALDRHQLHRRLGGGRSLWSPVGPLPALSASGSGPRSAPPRPRARSPRPGHLAGARWRPERRQPRSLPLDPATVQRIRRGLGLPEFPRGEDYFLSAPLLIQFSAEPFEYHREWPANVRLVGPGLWDPPGEEPSLAGRGGAADRSAQRLDRIPGRRGADRDRP